MVLILGRGVRNAKGKPFLITMKANSKNGEGIPAMGV
jgi:hypothetical protein